MLQETLKICIYHIFISASFEASKFCLKFIAEITFSLVFYAKKYENLYLLLYVQKKQTQVYRKLQETKLAIRGQNRSY
jgi:hypothetical protein